MNLGKILEPFYMVDKEQIARDSYAEWVLNGEASPNGNAVPITFLK
jgi:hypothetical protein